MKLFIRKSFLFLIFLILPGLALAETAYVTDSSKIRVRAGKGEHYDPISAVSPGTKVEVLAREHGWTKIRFGKNSEGWIMDRFIVRNPPATARVMAADAESQRLREELAAREKELQALKEERDVLGRTVKEKDLALEDADIRYKALMGEPNEAMQLRVEKERLEDQLQKRKKVMEDMEAVLWERNIKLFSLGAGVLLAGLLFGLYMGKKGRRSYY